MTDKAPGGEPNLYELSHYGIVQALEDSERENCYVRVSDYDALRAQLAAAEKERDELRQERIWASAVLNQANELPSALRRAEQAESRLAAAEADSRRYRWLRLNMTFQSRLVCDGGTTASAQHRRWYHDSDKINETNLDSAIDAALRSAEGGKDD